MFTHRCACKKYQLHPKKTRSGKTTHKVKIIGTEEYHGVRACFDLSNGDDYILAVSDPLDPLNKKVDTTLLNSDDNFFETKKT